MARDGHRYSTVDEILKLKHLRMWNRCYSKWMKKRIHPASVHASEGELEGKRCLDPTTGKKLFTPETKIAFNEQMIKCKFLGEVR
jgi:hypothetical protein